MGQKINNNNKKDINTLCKQMIEREKKYKGKKNPDIGS